MKRQALIFLFLGLIGGALWSQGDRDNAVLLTPELLEARSGFIRKLSTGLKFREALNELLELRTEVPKQNSLFIDYWIGTTYRSIAEALRDGYMFENERGELFYQSEIDQYYQTREDKDAILKRFQANRGYFTEEEIKALSKGMPAPSAGSGAPSKITTNQLVYLRIGTNQIPFFTVTTNVRSENVYRTNYIPDREITITNLSFSTNSVETSNMILATNIFIITNVSMKTNKLTNTDLSPEGQIYNFYPTDNSLLGTLRKIQIQTNKILSTILTVNTNWTTKLANVVTTNRDFSKRMIKADPPFTVSTDTREVRSYTTNNQVRQEIITNTETNEVVSTNYYVAGKNDGLTNLTFEGHWSSKPVKALTPASLKYYDLALRWFNRLAKNGYNNAFQESAILQKAEIYRDINEQVLSIETYNFFVRNFPRSKRVADVLIDRANVFMDMQKFEEAVSVWKEIQEIYPDSDKKDYVQMKLDYAQMLLDRKRRGLPLDVRPMNDAEIKRKLLENFDSEIRKKETRLKDLEGIRDR